jgi:hypothetical protein
VPAPRRPLSRDLPALKASPAVYSFGLEHSKECYYVLMLAADTPRSVLEATADIIEAATAFSTVKQVDAAYEEADSLTGGRARPGGGAWVQQRCSSGVGWGAARSRGGPGGAAADRCGRTGAAAEGRAASKCTAQAPRRLTCRPGCWR